MLATLHPRKAFQPSLSLSISVFPFSCPQSRSRPHVWCFSFSFFFPFRSPRVCRWPHQGPHLHLCTLRSSSLDHFRPDSRRNIHYISRRERLYRGVKCSRLSLFELLSRIYTLHSSRVRGVTFKVSIKICIHARVCVTTSCIDMVFLYCCCCAKAVLQLLINKQRKNIFNIYPFFFYINKQMLEVIKLIRDRRL